MCAMNEKRLYGCGWEEGEAFPFSTVNDFLEGRFVVFFIFFSLALNFSLCQMYETMNLNYFNTPIYNTILLRISLYQQFNHS
jgi:hypothetical protein